MSTSSIVQKLWNYCNVLRDDGMSYGDYPGPEQSRDDEWRERHVDECQIYVADFG